MKQLFVIAFFFFHTTFLVAQDYMDVIAKKSCECVELIPDTLVKEQLNMKLGVCMLEAARPYKKQIKKDYNIDLDKVNVDWERLGTIVGVRLASECPNLILKFVERNKTSVDPVVNNQKSIGIISKIENDFFVLFSLKDENGRVTKYLWLNYVDSDFDMVNSYATLVGQAVTFFYEPMDLFDPRVNEYRQFMVIKKMILVSNEQ